MVVSLHAIGIGVSGLADVFVRMGYEFGGPEAKELNSMIFETIYHAALESSGEMAEEEGKYDSWEGSPTSQGILQQDMWEKFNGNNTKHKSIMEWDGLRKKIAKSGLRNSLLVAQTIDVNTGNN